LELPEGKSLFTAGYAAVIHLHTAVEECTVVRLLAEIDPKTKEITKKLPKFSKSRSIVNVHIQLAQSICMESFKEFPQLGRFTLRDEGKTIALGKVLYVGPPRKKAAK
jgi:peptide chain release factor subunit 3